MDAIILALLKVIFLLMVNPLLGFVYPGSWTAHPSNVPRIGFIGGVIESLQDLTRNITIRCGDVSTKDVGCL